MYVCTQSEQAGFLFFPFLSFLHIVGCSLSPFNMFALLLCEAAITSATTTQRMEFLFFLQMALHGIPLQFLFSFVFLCCVGMCILGGICIYWMDLHFGRVA